MTATEARPTRVPPRVVIRVAWLLHRALLRFSGGRVGLRAPGDKFGLLRLTTVGRRSGQPRVAIVGYYEDGPNLVTLAMNGWAEADPAWWLNLQAHPDTVVDLKGGSRAVRGRTAEGEELGDFPLVVMSNDYGNGVEPYTDEATNVEGGMEAWAAEGLPFAAADGSPGQVA